MTKRKTNPRRPVQGGLVKSKSQQRERRFSRLHAPSDLSIEDWQIALRRQHGREQNFELENLDEEPIFSEFRVTNPDSATHYRVAIRGAALGENYCACPDFATNELGTCKHIEFTLAKLERRRGGKRALREGFHPSYSEVWLEYGARRRVRLRPGSQCPKTLLDTACKAFDPEDGWVLRDPHDSALDRFLAAAESSRHELRVYADARDLVAAHRRDRTRGERLTQLFPEGATSPGLRDLLSVSLYPYQAEGALFAARAGRALLADEMGLGKTVQAVAMAEILLRHLGAKRVLVVCPTSLKHQWQGEIERFAGHEATVIDGNPGQRSRQFTAPGAYKIINYERLRRDRQLIDAWAPDLLIVDEAQRIKNWNTIAARELKRIDTPYALVLTGTPLENRLSEILSIVQLIDRRRLGPTWRFLHRHQAYEPGTGRVVGYRELDRIGETLAPIMLRRRKADVMSQLPRRIEKHYVVELTDAQRRMHDECKDNVARIVNKWRRHGFLSDTDQKRLMALMQTMRMSCNSTYLVDGETNHSGKLPEVTRVLDELLEEDGAKVVVFSQWLRTHELLAHVLEKRRHGYVTFTGSVPSTKRGALVKRFREDPQCRVFLATDAGGTGLNLQHASAVIHVDLPWSPAVLEQRTGRVHRIGQERPVQVATFVAQSSIEQRLVDLIGFKQSLFAGALDGGEAEVTLEGSRLNRFMESVEQTTVPIEEDEASSEGQPAVLTPAEAMVPTDRPTSSEVPTSGAAPAVAQGSHAPATNGSKENGTQSEAEAAPPVAENPWAPLVAVGRELLDALAGGGSSATGEDKPTCPSVRVENDSETGEHYLRLPMPKRETVEQLAGALQALLSPDGRRR